MMTIVPLAEAKEILPQWSQPRIGWMTWKMLSDPPAFIVPQWSQPRIGWVTWLGAVVETANALPQWSQPRIGWMTCRWARFPACRSRRRNGAGREPTGWLRRVDPRHLV